MFKLFNCFHPLIWIFVWHLTLPKAFGFQSFKVAFFSWNHPFGNVTKWHHAIQIKLRTKCTRILLDAYGTFSEMTQIRSPTRHSFCSLLNRVWPKAKIITRNWLRSIFKCSVSRQWDLDEQPTNRIHKQLNEIEHFSNINLFSDRFRRWKHLRLNKIPFQHNSFQCLHFIFRFVWKSKFRFYLEITHFPCRNRCKQTMQSIASIRGPTKSCIVFNHLDVYWWNN